MGQTKKNGAAQTPVAGRNYKSTVFAMLFGQKQDMGTAARLRVQILYPEIFASFAASKIVTIL